MGAYLHLRGLAELDDSISDSTSSRETSESPIEPGCAAGDSFSARSPGFLASSASTSNTINDCANFWAGQLDDVFEDLEVKSRPRNLPTATMGWSGIGEHDVPKIITERGWDRKEKGECSSGSSGLYTQEGSVENRTIDVRLLDHGGPSGSFHQSSSREEGRDGAEKESCVADGPLRGGLEESGATRSSSSSRGRDEDLGDQSERLPDHLLIELLVRVPTRDWPAAACVKKRWAHLFRGDGLWHSALTKKWPGATSTKRWPGPIARGSSKRRYTALYVSDSLFARNQVEGVNEVAGHVYLFLKEQLESPTPPVSYGLLHGTIIDQFLACCKTGDEAHNLASHIWIAVLDNLDESENTFRLLMRIAEEWDVFPGYPYSKSHAVQWRLFERLFTDFRDCLSQYNYFDVLTRVRNKFEMIPQTWLGY